jgi:hypothetical protein
MANKQAPPKMPLPSSKRTGRFKYSHRRPNGGDNPTMVQLVSRPEYVIDNLPGFEHLRVTDSSTGYLSLPASVAFAHEREAVLQSAREAWAFRVSSGGTLESNQHQSTRTAALGVKIDGRYYIAIDDSDDPAQNILLGRPQEGKDAHATQNKWLLPKNDPLIYGMLDRAEKAQRVFPALEQTVTLSTVHTPASAYGTHPITRALLGEDLTESVATYLRDHGRANCYVWTLSPTQLNQLGVDNEHVEVRRVGVGGGDYGIGNLSADIKCDVDGHACGVRKAFRTTSG